jgi:hypothetical protein
LNKGLLTSVATVFLITSVLSGVCEQVGSVCIAPPSNLISWWPGDGNANDVWDSNPGTSYGATFATGKVGQAFSFDGLDDYVVNPDYSTMPFPKSFSFWFYAKDSTNYRPMIREAGGALIRTTDGTNRLEVWSMLPVLSQSLAYQSVPTLTFNLNEWNHVVVALTDSTSGTIYLNGVPETLSFSTYTTYGPNDSGIQIGKGDQRYFNGLIDEVSIYNRALTSEEAQSIYNAGSEGICKPECTDSDKDGFSIEGGSCGPVDCNDANAQTHPGSMEVCNGEDDNCNGQIDEECIIDSDNDGVPDSIDNCPTVSNADQADSDGDGSVQMPSGTVSLWKFDEASGTIAKDSVGTNDGRITGSTSWTTGKVNGGLDFDGTDGRVAIGAANDVALTETSPFSISAWINSNDVFYNSINDYGQVIASNYMGEVYGTDRGEYSAMFRIIDGFLQFAVNKKQEAVTRVQTPITIGWHFVTATYDGSVMKVYVDGVLKQSGTRSFGGSSPNTRGWNLGDFSAETVSSHGHRSVFYGTLDEVALYNEALTDSEIGQIYNSGASGDGVGDACDCDDNICDGRERDYCIAQGTPDPKCFTDNDNDGYASDVDCNDNDPSIHPGATELCNGIDDDCNGQTDDGLTAPLNSKQQGVCAGSTKTCSGAGGWSDDYSSVAKYEVQETSCDDLDNDCNGRVDEGLKTIYYQDSDSDGYGNPAVSQQACTKPPGYVDDNTDCSDDNAAINPGATEVCNCRDDNCNGQIDEGRCISAKEIDSYIQGLNDAAFKPPASERKNAFSNKLNAINKKDNQGAIKQLQNDVRSKADGSLGCNPKDDWITDPKAQKEVCCIIDEVIANLQSQAPPIRVYPG